MDGVESVGFVAHAEAGHADSGQLAGRRGRVAADVHGIAARIAKEADDAFYAGEPAVGAAGIEGVITGAATDVEDHVVVDVLHLHGVDTATRSMQAQPIRGQVSDTGGRQPKPVSVDPHPRRSP